jgi:hypothetical protein
MRKVPRSPALYTDLGGLTMHLASFYMMPKSMPFSLVIINYKLRG